MKRTLKWLSICLGLWLVGWVSAADAPPVILVIDTSSPQTADIIDAVDSVVSFIAAYNPVRLINTCSSSTISNATQDAEALRGLLSSVTECETFDQAQAVQQAVTQLGTQPGTIVYIMDGQHVSGDRIIATDPMKMALAQLQEQGNCLYVIPIGDAELYSTSAQSIDANAVKGLVNRVGCGTDYKPQQSDTVASILLQAYLDSQHRDVFPNAGQLALFPRSKAKLTQDITLDENIASVRIDVVWGEGELDVILEPPAGTTVTPLVNKGDGFQSLTIDNPPAGDWNITLSVTQVPRDQVGVVLFSQGGIQAEAFAEPTVTSAATVTTMTTVTVSSVATAEATSAVVGSETMGDPDVPISDPLPAPALLLAIIGLIAVGILIGVLRMRRRPNSHTNDFFDAPPRSGGTLHTRTTAELPRIDPGSLGLKRETYNQVLPTEPLQRVVITPPQEEQFRQFPANVVFISGFQQGQFVAVDNAYFTIGRQSTNRLRIQDVSVSREHARIIFDNAQNLYLIENVSQAGTQVNGQTITQRHPLYNGDVIKIGAIQMQFQLRI